MYRVSQMPPPSPSDLLCPGQPSERHRYHIITYGPGVGIYREWYVKFHTSGGSTDAMSRADVCPLVEGFKGKCHWAVVGWDNAVNAYRQKYEEGRVRSFDQVG